MICNANQPTDGIFVKSYEFLFSAKKYGQKFRQKHGLKLKR